MANSERWIASVELEDDKISHEELMGMEQSFLMVLFPDTDPVKISNTLKKAYDEGSGDPLVEAGETVWQIFYDKKVKRTRILDNMVREICTKGFTPQTAKLALMVANYNFDEAVLWLRKNGDLHALSRLIYDETSEWTSKRSLYIKNIAPTMSKQELREKFEEWGKLVRCTLPLDPETGQSKSYAFVEYRKAVDAVRAMKNLHNCVLYGRKVRISFSKSYPRSARFRQKGVKPPERPGRIRQENDSDVESIATSAQSIGWAHHFRQRRLHQRLTNVKDIPNDREVQIAKKYGHWREAWNGRWQVEHEGYVYIFAKDRSTVITMWPEDIDMVDKSKKERSLLKNLKKLRQENGILRDNLKRARNIVEQEKNHVDIMGFKLPRVSPKDSSKLRKVLQDLTKLTNKLRVMEHEATAPSWAKPQKPKLVKKIRKSQQAKIPIEQANWFKLKPFKKRNDVKQRRQQERDDSTIRNQVIAAKVDNLEEQIKSLRSEMKKKPQKQNYIDPYIQTTPIAEAYAFAMRQPSPTPDPQTPLTYTKVLEVKKSTTPPKSSMQNSKINIFKSRGSEVKADRELTPDVEMFVADSKIKGGSRQKSTPPESNVTPNCLIQEPSSVWQGYNKSSEALLVTSTLGYPTLGHSTEISNPMVLAPFPPSPSPPATSEGGKHLLDKILPPPAINERIRRYPSYSWDTDKANLMSEAPSCVQRMRKIREEYQVSGMQVGFSRKGEQVDQSSKQENEGESQWEEAHFARLQDQSNTGGSFYHLESSSSRSNDALISTQEKLPPNSMFANSSFSLTSSQKTTPGFGGSLEGECHNSNQFRESKSQKPNSSAPCSQIEGRLSTNGNEGKDSSWLSSKCSLKKGGSDKAKWQTIGLSGFEARKNAHDLSKDWTSGSWEFTQAKKSKLSATSAQFIPQSRRQPQQVSTQASAYSGWGSCEVSVDKCDSSPHLPPGSNLNGEVQRTSIPVMKKDNPRKKTKGLIMGPHDPTESVSSITHDMSMRGKKGKNRIGGLSKRGRGGFGSRCGKKRMSGSRGRGSKRRYP